MPKKNEGKKPSENFVSAASLKNYAVATGSLTLVINTSLYIYKIIRGTDMPNALLICIALVMSILYILSFFKREEGLSLPQHIWISFLNSLMLFTSISGINGMLDSARQQYDARKPVAVYPFKQGSYLGVQQASMGDFFKYLIFPTHGWFNSTERQRRTTEAIISSAMNTISTTRQLADTLINEKMKDRRAIDTLRQKIDTLLSNYNATLALVQQADSSVRTAESLAKTKNTIHSLAIEVNGMEPQIRIKVHRDSAPDMNPLIDQLQQQQEQLKLQWNSLRQLQ